MEPEYLLMFSNTGGITIQVRFKNFDGSISNQKMHPQEISKLVNSDGDGFISKMRFDDYLFDIEKIDISILKKRIVVYAYLK